MDVGLQPLSQISFGTFCGVVRATLNLKGKYYYMKKAQSNYDY